MKRRVCIDCNKSYVRKGRGGGLRCEPCQKEHKKESYEKYQLTYKKAEK
jgi:ribosomal protein L37AE/L43A